MNLFWQVAENSSNASRHEFLLVFRSLLPQRPVSLFFIECKSPENLVSLFTWKKISTQMKSKIFPMSIDSSQKILKGFWCSGQEIKLLQVLTGSLKFLGSGILSKASFAARHNHESISSLFVDINYSNKLLIELQCFSLKLYVSGTLFSAATGEFVFDINCICCKQTRFSFLSMGSEMLAATTAADRGFRIAEGLKVVSRACSSMPFICTEDWNRLGCTVTSLHEEADYRLPPALFEILDSFKSAEIFTLQWIFFKRNWADGLTTQNHKTHALLNKVPIPALLSPSVSRWFNRTDSHSSYFLCVSNFLCFFILTVSVLPLSEHCFSRFLL